MFKKRFELSIHLDDWALPLRIGTFFYDWKYWHVQFLCFHFIIN